MNVTRVLLAKDLKFPSMTAWEFEERLELEVSAVLAQDAQEAWREYLNTEEHETFTERLRQVFSEEHKQSVRDELLRLWSGE